MRFPGGNRKAAWSAAGLLALVAGCILLAGCEARGGEDASAAVGGRSLTDRSVQWPSWNTWRRVLLLEDYNTRVVVAGTALLGLAAGTIGSFTLLRKRALMGDALSHATLPGIALAFIMAGVWGYDGKALPILLAGAAASGVLGMASIVLIRNLTRLKEDAALGIVLSVFFGGGVALLDIAQKMPSGNAAGLEGFIYGKTASMVAADAWLIGCAGGAAALIALLLFKELRLLCFDEGFAGSRGFPVVALDLVLMALVVVVTIIGLQAVGLILMIALLVIPAAAARFWTEQMAWMTLLSAGIGAISGMIGSAMSAIFPRLPSGAMIVLVSAALFAVSMVAGRSRGVLVRGLRRRSLKQKIDRQHLLRALYEILEERGALQRGELQRGTLQRGALQGGVMALSSPIAFDEVLATRSWSAGRLRRAIRRAAGAGQVRRDASGMLRLSEAGLARAAQLVREHRLWEMYLITHADVAPSRVDRDADAIEHVLDAAMIAELQTLVEDEDARDRVPQSPHGSTDLPTTSSGGRRRRSRRGGSSPPIRRN